MEIIGIDAGTSGTKITGWRETKFCGFLRVSPMETNEDLNAKINGFIKSNGYSSNNIKKIAVTGIKSKGFIPKIQGLSKECELILIDEFNAIALGGLHGVSDTLPNEKVAYIISMGTGTAFVRAVKTIGSGESVDVSHIGGTGIGGGFLTGLSSAFCGESDILKVSKLAESGDIGKVDLRIMDFCDNSADLGFLNPEITVSNFGKAGLPSSNSENAVTSADYAVGILTAVYQIIGMLAVFACRLDSAKNFVLIGALAELPQAREIFAQFEKTYGLNFHIPSAPEFAVAKGAILSTF
ncbi:MAG: hypothetical protein LBR74_02570 [Eubacterium sp.]|nr:hypothetical protein [Eubacterium sp.]